MNNEHEKYEWEDEDIKPRFELETVEQLQAVSDPIRYRMILLLRESAMTGAQLARALDLSRSRAHYYLKSLVDSNLVVFRGEKIANGMIGKYYRAIANYFSYDNLASRTIDQNAEGTEAIQIYKAISDFAITMMETSRDLLRSDALAQRGYHFSIEANLTEDQYEEVMTEIRKIVQHLVEMKSKNHKQKREDASLPFRTTIFFTPVPGNPMQFDPLEEKQTVQQ